MPAPATGYPARRLQGICLVCTALAACAPDRQSALPLTLENINRRDRGAASVSISPDGSRIAIVGTGPSGSGAYLLEAEDRGSQPTFWMPSGPLSWSPDSRFVTFVRDGEVWLAPAPSGEPQRLTSGMGDAREPAFSPDGGTVAFYSGKEGAQDIWLVPADGSRAARQLTREAAAPDDPRFTPAWSPDGASIAYVSNRSDYWADDLWLVDVATTETRQLSQSLMAASSPVWSPDGERIAIFGTAKDEYWYQDLAYIYLVDPVTGSEQIVDMQVYATDATMRNRPIWSDDGQTIYFPYQERGSYDLWSVPAHGGVATRMSNVGGVMRSIDATRGGHAFVFVRSTPTLGSDAYYLPASGGTAERVSDFATLWEGVRAPVEVSFRSFDGLYVQGFLYLPPGVPGQRVCPALVQVHGGGTNSYLQGPNLVEQYLASRGFVVMAINYRGGSGFGRSFQDLAVEDWLNGQALDAGAAADFLRQLPYTTDKVGIYGGSYGGSMSMAAITLMPDRFDAAVPMRGAYSKTETLDETDRLGKIFSVTGHGGFPDERPETYAKSNTITRIGNITAPVLLMHGELDRRVPFRHFELAVEELERHGKEFETRSYPEEGHGFRNPDNRIDMYARLEGFFERHLGACEPL